VQSKSMRVVAVVTAALLFGVVTDQASSHKLSSLAVRAFNGAVGTAVDLATPQSAERVAKAKPIGSRRSALNVELIARLQSPAFAEARPIEAAEAESTAPLGSAAAIAELPGQPGEVVASNLFEQPANTSRSSARAPSSGGGGGPSSGGGPGGSTAEASAASDARASEPPAERLDALMGVVMSDLDSEGGYHTASVGSSSDFKTTPTAPKSSSASKPETAGAATSSRASNAPELSRPDPNNNADAAPAPVLAEAAAAPVLASDVAFDAVAAIAPVGSGLVTDPADALIQALEDLLPPETASAEFIGLAPSDPILSLASPGAAPEALDTPMIVNPEPATLLLFGTGLAVTAGLARRRARRTVR
jgi:hypothetical protein